jgi:hypothetical protein
MRETAAVAMGAEISVQRLGNFALMPHRCAGFEPRACRECGCTDVDCSGCIARTGRPCHWVERDLCSACVGAREDQDGEEAPVDSLC